MAHKSETSRSMFFSPKKNGPNVAEIKGEVSKTAVRNVIPYLSSVRTNDFFTFLLFVGFSPLLLTRRYEREETKVRLKLPVLMTSIVSLVPIIAGTSKAVAIVFMYSLYCSIFIVIVVNIFKNR